jgi:hypothetical protein
MRMGPVEDMGLFNLHHRSQQMKQLGTSMAPFSMTENCMFMPFVLIIIIYNMFYIYNFLDKLCRHVATFIKKSERSANNDDKFTNLYMKHLDDDITEELVKLKFSQFGSIVSVKIMKRPDGSSLGFGFVSFQNPESAIKAQSTMNGMLLGMFIPKVMLIYIK